MIHFKLEPTLSHPLSLQKEEMEKYSRLEGLTLSTFQAVIHAPHGDIFAEKAFRYLNERRIRNHLPPVIISSGQNLFEIYKKGHQELMTTLSFSLSQHYGPLTHVALFMGNPFGLRLQNNLFVANSFIEDFAKIEELPLSEYRKTLAPKNSQDLIRQAFKNLNIRRMDVGLNPLKIPSKGENLVELYKSGFTELQQEYKQNRLKIAANFGVPILAADSPKEVERKLTQWIQTQGQGFQVLSFKDMDLTFLPPEIGLFTNLTSLDLDNNKLKILPKELGNLSLLEGLSVSKNQLIEVPKELKNLWCLRSLNLSQNSLSKLSFSMQNLGRLETLDLTGNRFTELPCALTPPPHLKNLFIANNLLKEIPAAISNFSALEWGDFDGNEIEKIDPEISILPHLKRLSVNENKLSDLPPELENFKNLKFFGLKKNKFEEEPLCVALLREKKCQVPLT